MEADLKRICDAIPVSNSGNVSTQASSILKGITGEEVEFDINTGGTLPTLFQPILSVGSNRVIVRDNYQNGGFPYALSVFIDNVLVYNSDSTRTYDHTVIASEDGKLIKAEFSGANFQSSSVSQQMEYISPGSGLRFSNKTSVNTWANAINRPITMQLDVNVTGSPAPTINVKFGTYQATAITSYKPILVGYRLQDHTNYYIEDDLSFEISVTAGRYLLINTSGQFQAFVAFESISAPSGFVQPSALPSDVSGTNGSVVNVSSPTVCNLTAFILDSDNTVLRTIPVKFTRNGSYVNFYADDESSNVYVATGQKVVLVGELSI